MKRTLSLILVLVLTAALLCACEFTSTSTTSTSTTDANGNTTTTTTTTTNNNGQTSTTTTTETSNSEGGVYHENVAVKLVNDTDFAMSELYISNNINDNWGDNILSELEDGVLNPGEYLNLTMSYYENYPIFDFKAVDEADGSYVEFDEMDVTGATSSMTITFSGEGDSYKISLSDKA